MENEIKNLSCMDCGVFNCSAMDKTFPQFCLTTKTDQEKLNALKKLYQKDEFVAKLSNAAAEVEGIYHGKLTRIEETIAFAQRIGAKKIGIASCIGLRDEAKIFAKILQAKGLESYGVICKVGAIDKAEVGLPEEVKVKQGCHESLCNPVLQAMLLNEEKTDLNVIVGLCVGHDSLFIKYSEAPVTTLLTKDRVLGHNPIAALHTTHTYYKRLLQEGEI